MDPSAKWRGNNAPDERDQAGTKVDGPLRPALETSCVRVGVVGVGYWGKNIARTIAELGALGAVVDANEETARQIATALGARPLTYPEALSDPALTAIAIAAPAELHFRLAMRALAAGKHVFVEKPLALEIGDAEALVSTARAASRVLMVGHLLQYHQGYRAVRDIVDCGGIGRVRTISSRRLSLGKVRREEDVMWSFAPHDISMVLGLVGEEPASVVATGLPVLPHGLNDLCHIQLVFPSGVQAYIDVSWIHPRKEQRLVVIGESGAVVFDDIAPAHEKVVHYSYTLARDGATPILRGSEAVAIPLPDGEPLRAELQEFLYCCRTGAQPRTDGAEALRVLSILKRANACIAMNKHSAAGCRSVGSQVHATAIVDDNVKIGEGSKIWHFSHILSGTSIGRDVVIGQNVMIGPDVQIGNNVKVQNNVCVYQGVTVEDGVFCGPSCVFTNVLDPRAGIERKDEFRQTLVRRGATIGANATIVCGHVIGRYAFVGAGAVVTRDVPDFALVIGVPARQAGWVSRAGRRLGSDLVCPETGERYRLTPRGKLEEAS